MSVTETNAKKKGLADKVRQEEDAGNIFRPKTGKAPKARRQQVEQTGGIGNYLYTKGKLEREEKARQKQKLLAEQQVAI